MSRNAKFLSAREKVIYATGRDIDLPRWKRFTDIDSRCFRLLGTGWRGSRAGNREPREPAVGSKGKAAL